MFPGLVKLPKGKDQMFFSVTIFNYLFREEEPK